MKRILSFISRHSTLGIVLVSTVIAAISVIVRYYDGTILAYGDAESHINIAKRVVSGLTPGFGQLGGVWLPLHHLLMVPFVTSDFMWRTGLGGAVVSAACFVMAATVLYLLGVLLTNKRWIGLIIFAVFASNPNILYMLATPMSELPLIAFTLASMYFFIKWAIRRSFYDLILAGVLVFLASLIRYDAWFLIFIEFVSILIVALRDKWPYKKIEGLILTFLAMALFGVALWLVWSAVIFHDPFYFMDSPYSAKSQQLAFLSSGLLPSYHNLVESVKLYAGAAIWNVGSIISFLAAVGAVVYLAFDKSGRSVKAIVTLLFISPFLFNVLSLVLGISILFVPGVTPQSFPYHIFNIRYGMLMVPAAAVFIGLLLNTIRPKLAKIIAACIVAVSIAIMAFSYPITLRDGLDGLSARFPGGIGGIDEHFSQYYDHGDIAFDDFARSANPVDLGVPMNRIIYVGNHPYWENMVNKPNAYARWIIIRKDDSLYSAFRNSSAFKNNYTAVYTAGDTTLYKCTGICTGTAQ